MDLELVLQFHVALIFDVGGVGVGVGAEVAEHHEGFGLRGVFEGDAGFRGGFGAEDFVVGQFVEADHLGAVEADLVRFSLGMSLTSSDQGTSRPSTSDWYMPKTSEPHCGS